MEGTVVQVGLELGACGLPHLHIKEVVHPEGGVSRVESAGDPWQVVGVSGEGAAAAG